ncbi:competence/damage-inducible protein A [Entomobacter blattae]|uniref:Putative molybdopterin binding domain protein n=1 Tax=Entomobacter blattae TaxID=2762277 RepID=A0A7H1NUU7_9PROT|nr:molybdopterin-binding protein [Entomobacter blattae]QNT79557.1 putative molybdopterin binding domain protein [Entomobacter blattae]
MNPTACILIIGNEILSGRTQDANIQFLAQNLGKLGINLQEIRVIPDQEALIVHTVNETRKKFSHVITTGGIGPTHDDITAPSIAKAFGVPWEIHEESFKILEAHFRPGEFNTPRQRMATLPRGAIPIRNPISAAPGFSMDNVHVLAGVPEIMRAMFLELAPHLSKGAPIVSRTWYAFGMSEGQIAEKLEEIQSAFPTLDIGSYPFKLQDQRKGVALVVKGHNENQVKNAAEQICQLIADFGLTPHEGEPTAKEASKI